MAEAAIPSITLHDIASATFKVMLRFLYTDVLPGDNELGRSPVAMFQDLLAAANRYALDLKKRAKTAEPETQTTIVGSAVVQFRVDYQQAKQCPVGKAVHSDIISAGGHLWRIECYPCGDTEENGGRYLSIFLRKKSKSRNITAIFEVFLADGDGKPSKPSSYAEPKKVYGCFEFDNDQGDTGWREFHYKSYLDKFVIEGHITFVCSIMVIDNSPIPVPPSDIGTHLGRLLDHADGTDVSFVVDGETFLAHRWVLAARSPVFRAELFGSMTEATMQSITLHEMAPATFRIMLRFMYTDGLPEEDELGDSPLEIFQDLLAAADRYALDRLKLMCAQKLLVHMTVDTVATVLACAETYNCPELKNKCLDFFAVDKHFKKAVFTDGFVMLMQKFPTVADALRDRVGA
ncbi:BTB/POZ and MATH domain-containing protein 1-like [Lolium rigidum]|uniref:BTB/POZ and MATH domain-containing protein 1-like n=1 Tax=Lolium rigidum TaxID=89674 RepID=UPI001F5D8BAC|nr:BTB/POZ and MATH domain-containing protein 1-like [Lolium rigidum]